MVETTCNIQSTILANRPSHEEEPWASATSLALMTADDKAPAGPSAMAAAVLETAEAMAEAFAGSIAMPTRPSQGFGDLKDLKDL